MMVVALDTVPWRRTTLGAIVAETGGHIQTGPFGSQLHASDYVQAGTPLIMPINIGDNEIAEDGIARIGARDVRRLRRHLLRECDIVFSRRGDVGRRSIVRREQMGWVCGTGCLAVRFGPRRDKVNPHFVALYLGSRSVQAYLQDNAVGGTMPNLNTGILSSTPIVLPPKPAQDSIVNALNTATDLVATLERLIAKKYAFKQGMMYQLLTGQKRLAGYTLPWVVEPLREDITLISGHHVLAQHCNTRGDGIPYLTGPADFPDGRIRQTKFTDRPKSMCKANDILLTVKGSGAGSMVEANESYCISRQLMAIRTNRWNSRFLLYSLLQNASNIRDAATGLIPGLSRSDVLDQTIPVPPVDEQDAIASALSSMDAELKVLNARLAKARDIKQGMMQQLLTGRTRLPVQEATL